MLLYSSLKRTILKIVQIFGINICCISFLFGFRRIRKKYCKERILASSCLSVCLFIRTEEFDSGWTFFVKFDIREFY